MNTLAELALSMMMAFAPPSIHEKAPWADPSEEYALTRYADIADAIGNVCDDAKNPHSCVALMVAIGIGESGFARDADEGPCYRGNGHKTRCDSGAAASVWQAHAYGKDGAGEDITINRLFKERQLAAWIVLRIARHSLRACKHLPAEDRLAGLGNGYCNPSKAARARYHMWQRLIAWKPKE